MKPSRTLSRSHSKREERRAHRAEQRASRETEFLSTDKHTMAHFINAYVYGNILVLAAIIAVDTHAIAEGHAALAVIGTGIATFIAHIFSEAQSYDVLREEDTRDARNVAMREAMKNARPIFSSAIAPALLFFVAHHHLITPGVAWQAAVWIVFWRLTRVGFITAKFRGEEATPRLILRGILMAVVCVGIAQLKVVLTH